MSRFCALGRASRRPGFDEEAAEAIARLKAFGAQGGMLALTIHHILELAQYENTDKVIARFDALCELSRLCVVSAITNDGPGSVVDLLALELLAALESPEANAESVAKEVWPDALMLTSGEDVRDWISPQPGGGVFGPGGLGGWGHRRVYWWTGGGLRRKNDANAGRPRRPDRPVQGARAVPRWPAILCQPTAT